jgi:hypothetical protein
MTGDIFVAGGHGGESNARVVELSKDGKSSRPGEKGTARENSRASRDHDCLEKAAVFGESNLKAEGRLCELSDQSRRCCAADFSASNYRIGV